MSPTKASFSDATMMRFTPVLVRRDVRAAGRDRPSATVQLTPSNGVPASTSALRTPTAGAVLPLTFSVTRMMRSSRWRSSAAQAARSAYWLSGEDGAWMKPARESARVAARWSSGEMTWVFPSARSSTVERSVEVIGPRMKSFRPSSAAEGTPSWRS